MLRTRKWALVLVALAGLVLCGSAVGAAKGVTAVIQGQSADKVHLREGPSAKTKSLGLYFTGTEVWCEAAPSAEWTRVQIGAQGGYIKTELLAWGEALGRVTPKQPTATVSGIKAGSWVNLRQKPSQNGAVAGTLAKGDTVTVLGETVTHWYYVQAGDQYGYMMSKYGTLGGTGSSGELSSGKPSGSSGGNASVDAALNAYLGVLRNGSAFFSPEHNATLTLSQLVRSLENDSVQITRFAVMDLDRDGIPEVILEQSAHGYGWGVEILRYQDGAVYGYGLVYRAFMDLAADGTFSFSSGASDNGFGVLKFTHDTCAIEERTYCQSSDFNGNDGVSYFVDRKAATKEAFDEAVKNQVQKPEAAWYDFTEANLKRALAQ